MALRPMSDIDILCRKKDIPRATNLLHDLGYGARQSAYFTRFDEARSREKSHHLPRFDHPQGVSVELHRTLLEGLDRDSGLMESVWQGSQVVSGNYFQFHTLSNEHMLLHLCLHLHAHLNSSDITLYWLCDIHEFIRKMQDRVHWDFFWSLVRDLDVQDRVQNIFHILHACWRTEILSSMGDCGDGGAGILRILFEPEYAAQHRSRHFLPARIQLLGGIATEYGIPAMIYFLLRILFPTGDYIRGRYGPEGRGQFFRAYVNHTCERFRRAILNAFLQWRGRLFEKGERKSKRPGMPHLPNDLNGTRKQVH